MRVCLHPLHFPQQPLPLPPELPHSVGNIHRTFSYFTSRRMGSFPLVLFQLKKECDAATSNGLCSLENVLGFVRWTNDLFQTQYDVSPQVLRSTPTLVLHSSRNNKLAPETFLKKQFLTVFVKAKRWMILEEHIISTFVVGFTNTWESMFFVLWPLCQRYQSYARFFSTKLN